ncbi:right-handed parallel beta-helix repeat-containing protein [bacterium]|nr:right-handed parallel beta-helix repeat-containing protein [bacterium]
MKRTFLMILVLSLVMPSLMAQITGTGTYTDPYRGINAGSFTISGVKYFDNNLGVSAGTLTLMPGTRLISKSRYACILISGTGQISAQGYSYQRILITADSDGDMVPGETTDFWGNIYITSTGTSNFNWCTVENGQRLRSKYTGGALHVSTGTVNFNNGIIRNSESKWGGGLYVEPGATVTVTNTRFQNNKASQNGGAVYIAAGSSPRITSSVFYGNSTTAIDSKGGAIASISASPVIVNSTFANNTSPAADGRTIYLENSPAAKIVNTVIWGGSSHIGLSGTPTSVFDICAIEGVTYAGCLTLNSSNTAVDGPNFTDPAMGDLTITFDSPLRDTGADSYSGVTVPALDFTGSVRVGVTDIGAYEMIYSRWKGGNTSWGDPVNWVGGYLPSGRNIIIPSGTSTYPTAAPGPAVTLNAGLRMIMQPGTKATFSSLTNNGTIDLHADASGHASMLTGSYSGAAGNINIDHFLTSGPAGDWWHYIAPPSTVSKTVFTDIDPDMLVRYDETKVVSDVSDGWQWHDGYDGTTAFSNLTAKEGYDVSVLSDVTMTYRNLKSIITTMGRIDLPFGGSGGDTTIHGYSLIGNSLTCGINWDNVSYSHDHTFLRHAYYITTASGEEASYVDGVGTNGATAHIAPLQGFFVRTRTTGSWINIPDNAREHNDAPMFKSAELIPLVRLTLSSATQRDETVVRFDPEATSGFDGLLDASKPFSHARTKTGHIKIYSEMGGENYSINSVPWPSKKTAIPLTIVIHEAGTYKITGSQMQVLDGCRAVLTDGLTGSRTELPGAAGYSFSATPGTITGRFTLEIIAAEKKAAVAAEEPKPEIIQETSLKIYSATGRVCILPQGSGWDGTTGKIRIFDITGRVIFMSDNERFNSGELKEFESEGNGGLLIVEVVTGTKRYLEKLFVVR